MTNYLAIGASILPLEQPHNKALEHISSKLDKDSYLSRLSNLFIYLAGGVVFLTSVLGLPYVAIKVRDLQEGITNFGQMVSQVNELEIGAATISPRLDKAEAKLEDIRKINDGLSEIVDDLNKGRNIEEYRTALEVLYEQSSRL